MFNLFCKDNNQGKHTVKECLQEDQAKDISEDEVKVISYSLNRIANKPLPVLQKDYPGLLVFPSKLNEYNDDIHKSVVFNMYPDSTIKTQNLMGFVGVDDVQLTIGSRFDEQVENKQYFLQYMLKKVFAINMVDFKTRSGNENIWDFLLMFMFPYFLNNALKQGIYKEYQKKKNNDFNVKGTIDIARHIKRNIPFMGKVAYNTREFSFDNSLTQLIRHTIEFIVNKGYRKALNPNSETLENVRIIQQATPAYNLINRQKIIAENYKKVKHPFFTEYEPLRSICMRILNHEGVSIETSKNKVHGLLFEGDWLWEEYLNTILKDCGFKHPENKTKKNGLSLFKNGKKIYPDFYAEKPNMVIDAKYKRLQHYDGIDTSDLYQVITYMYRLKAVKGILLYPLKDSNSNKNIRTIFKMHPDSYGKEDATFEKYGFEIPQNESDYEKFVSQIKKHEQELQDDVKKQLHDLHRNRF